MRHHVSLPLAVLAAEDGLAGERRSAIADYAYWTAIGRAFPVFPGMIGLPGAKQRH